MLEQGIWPYDTITSVEGYNGEASFIRKWRVECFNNMETKTKYSILIKSLKIVASNPDIQIKIMPQFVNVPDEIALLYHDAFLLLPQIRQENGISEKCMDLLLHMDELFDKMSENKSLWNIESLKGHYFWEETRVLAKAILQELNEIHDQPNMDFFSWVKG